jgi:hypothetical protein
MPEKRLTWPAFIVVMLLVRPAVTQAADAALVESTAGASRAFARYITSLELSRPWDSETVEIDASLPKLEKQGRLRAIRRLDRFGEPEYQVLEAGGDAMVRRQVIARYISAEKTAFAMTGASVAVSPVNYEFRFRGIVQNGAVSAYVFQIKPRKKRDGLIRGELWLDEESGAAVRLSGYLVKNSSIFVKRVSLIRETSLEDGIAATRLTHLSVETRLAGPAELIIQERPYTASAGGPAGNPAR